MQQNNLIYDWNHSTKPSTAIAPNIELCDETLRDGIQSPSVHDPSIEEKLKLICLMDKLGIHIADIGLPGAGPRAYSDVLLIAQYVKNHKLKIKLNCAARTIIKDIEPIASIQQKVGIDITAYCFLGTSPIRQMVEDWSLDQLLKTAEQAISFAVKEGLKVAFVTEDTTRSHPETLAPLFNQAICLGIERLVLCDTVGHATPQGIKALLKFSKDIIAKHKSPVKIDWHGHNDRGLAVSNAIYAAQYGCDRIHATALGIGERVGNTSMDQLIVNLKLLNSYPHEVSSLVSYVETAAKACQVPIPYNYPLCGKDAFRTATGVHAAAVIKAQKKGDSFLADTIYSAIPAYLFGKEQQIDIGPMSGASNIKYWLEKNGFEPLPHLVQDLLDYAKKRSHVLSEQEIKNFLQEKLLDKPLSQTFV